MKCPYTNLECLDQKYIHVIEILDNGGVADLHICQKCVPTDKLGLESINTPQDLIDFIMSNISSIDKKFQEREINICPKCNYSINDILQVNKLGCAECYKHFRSEIIAMLVRCQKSLKHIGKVPKNLVVPKEKKIKLLNSKLEQAVNIENYEEAAKIKKELDQL